jgi:uncharacterized membrane protein YecN with MAPEG domain
MLIPVTAATAVLCALLIVGLGLRVSQLRLRLKVALGDGGNPALLGAIRAHGNAVEYAPIFLVLSLCFEAYAGSVLGLVVLDSAFVVARLLAAWGLSRSSVHPARRLGAMLTYLVLLLTALWLALIVASAV